MVLEWHPEIIEDISDYTEIARREIINEIKMHIHDGENIPLLKGDGIQIFKFKIRRGLWVTFTKRPSGTYHVIAIKECLRDKFPGTLNASRRISELENKADRELERIKQIINQ